MKRISLSILLLGLLLSLLLCACSTKPTFPVNDAYASMKQESTPKEATAMILYDAESKGLSVTEDFGESWGNNVFILPHYVGSKVSIYRISAKGTDDYELAETPRCTVEAKADTVIRFYVGDLGANRMWALQVTLPDGKSYTTPMPYVCETDGQVVYAASSRSKEHLPEDWGQQIEQTEAPLKPVIYLYPQEETRVTVCLDYCGELTCTYPKYDGGWTVTAQPDGTLKDSQGKEYNYLYWEGEGQKTSDFSTGFCVKGEETAAFLETALEKLGLNRKEANEFIVYWLPLMEQNPYNVISFQTKTYEEAAKLHISPKPDSLIRVFMAWYGTDTYIELPTQELTAPERKGFTAVEWGGAQLTG